MLEANSIIIRIIREKYLEVFSALVNNIESQGAFMPAAMTSESTLRKQFAENGFISDISERYVITDRSDKILGCIWAFKSVPYFDAIEVGYQIFDAQSHGKGYATEALTEFYGYLFENKQVNRIELRIATGNKASEKVARKTGFIHEGTSREAAYSKGKLHDMNLFAMLRREWSANKVT